MDNTRGTLLEIKRATERKTNNASWDAPVFEEVFRPTGQGVMADAMGITSSIFGRMGEVASKMRAKFADDLSLGEMKGEIAEQRRQQQMANMQAMQHVGYSHPYTVWGGGGGRGGLTSGNLPPVQGLGGLGNQLGSMAHQVAMQNALSNQAMMGTLQQVVYGGGLQNQHFPAYLWPQYQAPVAVPPSPSEPTGTPVGLMEDEVMKEWGRRKGQG